MAVLPFMVPATFSPVLCSFEGAFPWMMPFSRSTPSCRFEIYCHVVDRSRGEAFGARMWSNSAAGRV